MKLKLFLLLLSALLCAWLLPLGAWAQGCAGVQVAYTTTESRCMSTGAITLAVTGGSGSYNYKVEGPVNTAYTSSNIITGLQAGTYTITVRDVNNNCITTVENVAVAGSYQDPRFTLSRTNVSCARNDGTITVNGLQYGRSPFTYTIVAPSPMGVGTTNSSGNFSNLVAGEYAIQLKDSCGGIQVRRITIEDYSWSIDATTIAKIDCNTVSVLVKVKDNKGKENTSSPADFTGFQFGVINEDGTTSWQSSHSFTYNLGSRRYLEVVVKDPCGNEKKYTWKETAGVKPAIGNISTASSTCSTFTAAVGGQKNLTSPYYNLYDQNTNVLVADNNTGAFANLAAGSYCVEVVDVCYDTIIRKCFTLTPPTLLLNNPVISARTCTTFTASITPANFTASNYCLYNEGGTLISCNTDGVFPNLAYGKYTIKATDACSGDVLEKVVDEPQPIPIINTHSISGTCTNYTVVVGGSNLDGAQYCLYDSNGNLVACNSSGQFENVSAGNYCVRAVVCGVTSQDYCIGVSGPPPAIDANVAISDRQCATFTATVTGQNYLTNPVFQLIDRTTNEVIATNGTGVFTNINYGSYTIKLTDGCNGAVIERYFEVLQPQPSVNPTMQQSNATCATFTARVTGANLINPQYNLYNAADQLLETNSTGIFNNLPWGTYCVVVTDGCTGNTFRVCQTFAMNYAITLTTSKTCAIGEGTVTASFTNGLAPYTVNVYNSDGTLKETKVTSSGSTSFTLPLLAPGENYTVTATDNCGRADTKTIAPDAMVVTKSINVVSKCPSSTYQNGSGNMQVTAFSNHKAVTPKIIKKDDVNWSRTHSSSSGNVYTFSDLAPGTYIVEYTIATCTGKLYDTVTVNPYTYPSQGNSAIYQCDNNSFTLNADVSGGIGPYNYQIIGSDPESPSIVTAEQASPFFSINNGTTYSLIRLRTIDACGNATLNDVSVLPLQNIIVKATNDCFYRDAVLSVDTIPNATYQWFKKTGINDSILLTTELTYNLPFMKPEDVGTYVARITINDGCLVRVASYTLDGDCGHTSLPNALQLQGKAEAKANVLSWNAADLAVVAYTIERKAAHDTGFVAIATRKASSASNSNGYNFNDGSRLAGTAQYRVKWITAGGKSGYSNIVRLQAKSAAAVVYPNPVTSEFRIAFSHAVATNYRISLHNAAGQAVYQTEMKQVTNSVFHYSRQAQMQAGMYLLKIVNTTTGETVHHKLLFK